MSCWRSARNGSDPMSAGRFTQALLAVGLTLPAIALAHNIGESNARFVEALSGPAVFAFAYLGAKHMVTGYDHLLYLVGILFYLSRPRDIALYVSLFAAGHSITLIAGVLAGFSIDANLIDANLIDAVIGLSIVYKAFENIGGFRTVFGFNPDPGAAVFVFGLCHGLGLATKLQELAISNDGLVINLVSFNVGVELGQVLALAVIMALVFSWQASAAFDRHRFAANGILMVCGFTLAGYQLTGYFA